MRRIARAWEALSRDQRLAGIAALGLLLAMFLPWYQQNAVDRHGLVSNDLNAFAAFSFAEAVILLTVIAVLVMLFARAENRPLPLPGSDGALVMAAGIWSCLLLVLRLFDKPGMSTAGVGDVGVQWGIFFALGASGVLTYAGSRMRAGTAGGSPEAHAGRPRQPRRTSRPAHSRRASEARATATPWLEVPRWVPAARAGTSAEPTPPESADPGHDGAAARRASHGTPRTAAGRRAVRSASAQSHQQLSLDESGQDAGGPRADRPSDPD